MIVLSKNLQNNLWRILRVKEVVKTHLTKKINNLIKQYSNHNSKPLSNRVFQNFIIQVQLIDKQKFKYKQKFQTKMKLRLA